MSTIRRAVLLLWIFLAAPAPGAADSGWHPAAAGPDLRGPVVPRHAAGRTIEPDRRSLIGPDPCGTVGAPAARRERVGGSAATTAPGGDRPPARLAAGPVRLPTALRGTSAPLPGRARPGGRADPMAYLHRVSNGPTEVGAGAAEARRATGAGGIGLLAAGPGAAETHAACTACHSERIVIQQGLPRRQWDELLDWMVDEHGMAPLRGRLREIILDYLARQYGRDRPNYPAR